MLEQTQISSTSLCERNVDIFEPLPDGDRVRYEAERTIPGRSTSNSTPVSTPSAPSTSSLNGTEPHQEQEPNAMRAHSSADSLTPTYGEEGNGTESDEDLLMKGEDPPIPLEPTVRIVKRTPRAHASHRQGYRNGQPGYFAVEFNSARVEPTIDGTIHELPSLCNGNSHERTGRHGGVDLTSSARASYRNIRYEAGSSSPAITDHDKERDREICKFLIIVMLAIAGLAVGGRFVEQSMKLETLATQAQLDKHSYDQTSAPPENDMSTTQSFNPKQFTTEPTTFKLSSTAAMPLSRGQETMYFWVGTIAISVSLCLIIYAIYRVRAYIVALADVCVRGDSVAITELLV